MQVYVVSSVWLGILDNVKVFRKLSEAQNFKAEVLKALDTKADKWDDEPRENMDYGVIITECELK